MAAVTREDGARVFTVSEFAATLNAVLAEGFRGGVWVEGEIRGYRSPKPHLYFDLVEETDDGRKASLNVAIFANVLNGWQRRLRDAGIVFSEGMKVRLRGVPDIYAPSGRLSLKVTDIDTVFTVGDIAARREELIKKLRADGTTEKNKRLVVPAVPLRLGIVSSSQAAGFADARQHLIDSGFSFAVTLCDVRVQGDEAVPMIAAALGEFGRRADIDVVLVLRGGGAKGDLAAFDDERVARAIAACPHPVFTGIGHETDRSIADMCAHTECRTPTACADEVIDRVGAFVNGLGSVTSRIRTAALGAVGKARAKAGYDAMRLRSLPRAALQRARHAVEVHSTAVRLLDPATTLARGWSITRDASGHVVRSASAVAPGETLVTTVADGEITSKVEGDR